MFIDDKSIEHEQDLGEIFQGLEKHVRETINGCHDLFVVKHGLKAPIPFGDMVLEYVRACTMAIEEQVDNYKRRWPRFATTYEVNYVYGGPEEGGWYYDMYTKVAERRLEPQENVSLEESAEAVRYQIECQLFEEYGDLKKTYTSVNGGKMYVVALEYIAGENETKERPHYE